VLAAGLNGGRVLGVLEGQAELSAYLERCTSREAFKRSK
jgi:hypothetical protein